MTGIVEFIKKTDKGFFGKITDRNGELIYFDTSSVAEKTFFKAGDSVCFTVFTQPDGREKAINVFHLEKLVRDGQHEKLLRMLRAEICTPDKLGADIILYAIKAISAYLGENIEISLNDFQRALIETRYPNVLVTQQGSEDFLRQGLQSSYEPMTLVEFTNTFKNTCHSQDNLTNTSWEKLTTRFWGVKNELAFYINALWLLHLKGQGKIYDCFKVYIELGSVHERMGRILDLLRILKDFSDPDCFKVSERLKKKIVGSFLDCNNINALCKAIIMFDDASLPELKQLPAFLSGEVEIDSDTLIGYFSEESFGAKIAQKLVNLFWYRSKDTDALPEKVLRVLSFVSQTLGKRYTDVILYLKIFPDFTKNEKSAILLQEFPRLCKYAESDSSISALVKYIHEELLPSFYETEELPHIIYPKPPEIAISPTICINPDEEELDRLIREQRFVEAIRWAKTHSSSELYESRAALRKIVCENFKARAFSEKAYDIFTAGITAEFAEELILEGFRDANHGDTGALFAICVYQKNWLKLAYMYAPFNATQHKTNPKLYETLKSILADNGIDADKYARNHYDVVKVALRVLSNEEFDSFIEWAGKIPIRYSSHEYNKKIVPRLFDGAIRNMLSKTTDYNSAWNELLGEVLRKDSADKVDMLRYSIITSYLGRFGASNFERIISQSLAPNSTKDYFGCYSSIWRGLFAGRYGCNIISLNIPLIDEAPATYWNIFYDVAVCKNRVFTLDKLWGTWWHTPKHKMQEFYSSLLTRYSADREAVFLQIAVMLLEQCRETLDTQFEKYLTYCNSNKNKDFLFRAMIHLIRQKRYLNEIGNFLRSSYWYMTETERRLSQLLTLMCDQDLSKFNEQLQLDFDEYQYEKFAADFLDALSYYPKADVVSVVRSGTDSESYKYRLIKHIFQIAYSQAQFDSIQKSGSILRPQVGSADALTVRNYAELMDVCYRKQLQTSSSQNLTWIQNRYHRIFACTILLHGQADEDKKENILTLMQKCKHYSSVHDNYKNFSELLLKCLGSATMSLFQKQSLLLSVISNKWDNFIDNILEYHPDDLERIRSTMELSNYRSLNMQLLERYLITLDCAYSDVDTATVNAFSPLLGYILSELKTIEGADREKHGRIVTLLTQLCRLTDESDTPASYEVLKHALQEDYGLLEDNWALFDAALLTTVYKSSIIFLFGDDIRNIKSWNESAIKHWELVFRSGGQPLMYQYHYLVAVWLAASQRKEEAQAAYSKIISKKEIFSQWTYERKELEAYLEGRSRKFFVNNRKAVFSLSAEREAQNLDFVARAAGEKTVSCEEAGGAYKSLQNNPGNAAKLDAYKKLFGFVRSPDALYDVYRLLDSKNVQHEKKTYNELVIAFGSLLVVEDNESFRHDEKFTILSSMMDVFELLSDINKEKTFVIEQLKAAEGFVLGTPGLCLETWLGYFERISAIMSHPAIGNPAGLLDELRVPVEQCIRGIGCCETQMQRLEWLEQWRSNWNVSSDCSDYERAFVSSVEEELGRLRHGVNLHLEVLNEDLLIEDGCIFYQIENIADKSSTSILLNNNSARLEVKIGINGESPVVFDNAEFSSSIELRPGDICGQVYKLHSQVLSGIRPGDRVEIILNVLVDGVPICNNSMDKRTFRFEDAPGILAPDIISLGKSYDTDVPAFTRRVRGFGRKKEKELIETYLEDQQLVVIYGPSRAGKSSLLNYICNDYLDSYCSRPESSELAVVSVMIAGDENKYSDYKRNMLDPSQSVEGFDAGQMMEYLFLAPLQLAFGTEGQDSRCEYYGQELPEEVRTGIKKALAQSSGSVISKYKNISNILTDYNCELWLMFDEFQQTISRLSGAESDLASLCSAIKYKLPGIKLVLCGSDDLLRLFECGDDPQWNVFTIRTAVNSVPVGQLELDDFMDMMSEDRIWGKYRPFSDSALKLLHKYTGGNAICGKIFGNELLARLRDGTYINRKKIYPSDITQIAYSLLRNDVSVVYTQLIAHNEMNLENEIKYLLFIANELSADTNHADVSYYKIKDFFVSRSTAEIELALKILVARGILKTGTDKKRYGFTTMFYYDFYRSRVSEEKIQALHDAERIEPQTDHTPWKDQVIDILRSQPDVSGGSMVDIIDALDDPEIKSVVGKQYGEAPTIHQGDIVKGNKIGEQKISINAQTINTAFTTLLTGDSGSNAFLEAFTNMPTVGAYLNEAQKAELVSLSAELAECETPEDILDTQNRIEALTAPSEQQMLSDTVGAVVVSDDFIDVSEERWIELLGLNSQQDLERIRKLPTEVVAPLDFAVMLHNVFDKISKKLQEDRTGSIARELDYCPVAIMYCKVVEAVLKKLHTPIYIQRIGDAEVKRGGIHFRDLLDSDGVTILQSKDLTIGSFAFNIVTADRNNNIDKPLQFRADPKKDVIKCITAVSDDSALINKTWFSHAEDLEVVRAIRNRSAHEAAPISKSTFEWLVRVLFENGELVRIAELAKTTTVEAQS